MRLLLVVNPQSRRGRQLGDAVRSELLRLGCAVAADGDPPHEIDAIVAAGGDGTLVCLIGRALELGVPVGLVPLGTFNDLARSLAIPLDVAGACAVIASGRTRTIDVAHVNGAYYVNEASMGISSRLARLQTPADKQRLGFIAVVMSAFQALRHSRSFHAEVAYDGKRERFRAVQLTVANSNRFGGFVTVDDAAIDDGWLYLYAVEIKNVLQVFSVVHAMMLGRRKPARGLRTYRAKAFQVQTHRPHRITADGEPAGETPAHFKVEPKALRIFVP